MTTTKGPLESPDAAGRYVEEGAAFMDLVGLEVRARSGAGPIPCSDVGPGRLDRARSRERFDVVVIGGGQAGLTVGHHLAKAGLQFVILDASERIGDAWRDRWDSLRLFTPARFDGLVGMPFPAPGNELPTKDAMADYLQAYAAKFELPVRSGTKVTKLSRHEGRYLLAAGDHQIEADQVVVAMSNYQHKRVPEFAKGLRSDTVQLHSSQYRNPSQLRPGGVLIVGAGNSGSEIALELAPRHETWMSGRDVGHIPFRIGGLAGRLFLVRLVLRCLFHRVLTLRTPLGRKVYPKVTSQGGPLIRVKPKQLAAAGVKRVPRVAGVEDGRPVLDDGRVLDVANVIWCTGFHPGFSAWIDLPVLGKDGSPVHAQGVVEDEPGLYFVGLHFLSALSSAMIHGVDADARRIARVIIQRRSA